MSEESKINPNKKFAILVYKLPPKLRKSAMRHFPIQHIVEATPSKNGLKVYFDDYQYAKEGIQRRTITVEGTPYSIYALVTDLTVHGIRKYASKDDIREIMKSYGSILDLYPIKRKEKIKDGVKVSLSDNYRINLDSPECASYDLSPVRLPGGAFEVTFYCRHCDSNGHKRWRCPRDKSSSITASTPQQRNKYYDRSSRETRIKPGPFIKESGRKLHRNSGNTNSSIGRRSNDTDTTSIRMNESRAKQSQRNHGEYRRTSLQGNTLNSLLNSSNQERPLKHRLSNSSETSNEMDTFSIPVLLNGNVPSPCNSDMSRISLKDDASDSLVYENKGVQYHEIDPYEKIFHGSGSSNSLNNQKGKGHQYSPEIINSCTRISSEPDTLDFLANQQTEEQNCNGYSVYNDRRLSGDIFNASRRTSLESDTLDFLANQQTDEQYCNGYNIYNGSRQSGDIFNAYRRTSLETNKSNSFVSDERHHNKCNSDSTEGILYKRESFKLPENQRRAKSNQISAGVIDNYSRTTLGTGAFNSVNLNTDKNSWASDRNDSNLTTCSVKIKQEKADSGHSPVSESGICDRECRKIKNIKINQDQSRRSRWDSIVPNCIQYPMKCTNVDSISIKKEHENYPIKKANFVIGDLQPPAHKKVKSEYKEANSSYSNGMLSHLDETAETLKSTSCRNSHGSGTEGRSKRPQCSFRNDARLTRGFRPMSGRSQMSETVAKKSKNSLRNILMRILPPHVSVKAMHEHLEKSVDSPKNVAEVATDLQKVMDWYRNGVHKRIFTKEEKTVFKWIRSSLEKCTSMKRKVNSNKCSQMDSTRQLDAKNGQSESTKKTPRQQRIRTLTPAIVETIYKTYDQKPGMLPPEELHTFLDQVRGRKKQLYIAELFTKDIPGLAKQLRDVKDTYYKYGPRRGAKENADISFLDRLAKRLEVNSNSEPEGSIKQESSDGFMMQSKYDGAELNGNSSIDDPSDDCSIQSGGPNPVWSVTVKEEVVVTD